MIHHPLLPAEITILERCLIAAYQPKFLVGCSLDIHWDTCFSDNDGYFTKLLTTGLYDVLDL